MAVRSVVAEEKGLPRRVHGRSRGSEPWKQVLCSEVPSGPKELKRGVSGDVEGVLLEKGWEGMFDPDHKRP